MSAMTDGLPKRSQLARLHAPDAFWWATGIEDTFITEPWHLTGRTLDEYELTGHYERWQEDLGLIAELGVKTARYGVPWHRIQPAPHRWDWDFADRTLERLLELGVEPIVDLVHYGLPRWIEGAYLNPHYPDLVAEYAGRLAARFQGRIFWYTPLNEPRITAWYCGRLGWWPPFQRGWQGFLAVTLAVCRGIVRTVEALRAVDREIVPAHVDATDLFETSDSSLDGVVRQRQDIVFLALDLVSGRIGEGHPLRAWLAEHGVTEADLAWFREHAVDLPVIGMNMYPMYTQKRVLRDKAGRLRIRMPTGSADLVTRLGRLYYERYGAPLFISETAALGSLRRRQVWLDDSVAASRKLREEGVPLFGYTWWPLFALVAWAYRQGRKPASAYLAQMGLWDLDADPAGGLRRVRTPLVDAYRALVAHGANPVGRLAEAEPRLAVSS
jgi:beta-glucosidase/6-phospho-beta-glucosidase/beta-galactosidase